MSTRPRVHPVPLLVAAVLLVGGLNVVAYATNGRVLQLGQVNRATTSTIVRNAGTGPALRLTSRSGRPALSVSSRAVATGLDADLVDGYDGSQLGTRILTYRLGWDNDESNVTKSFPGLPPGVYWVRYEYHVSGSLEGVHIWLDNGTSTEILPLNVPRGGSGVTEGQVDARHGVVMRLKGFGAFSTYDRVGHISQISFIRLTSSRLGVATDVAPRR